MAEIKNVEMVQTEKNIMILNYDCLYTIFEYLDIWDVFAAEEVCMKFQTVAEMIKPSLKTVDFDRIIYRDKENKDVAKFVDEWMTILEWLGPQIKTFKFEFGKYGIVSYANRKANPLFKELTKCNFPAVKVVHIQNQSDSFDYLNDEILGSMFPLKQIEVLKVNLNSKLKGTFLSKLTNIQEIDLMHCNALEPQLFIDFCCTNPQLRSLRVSFVHATYLNRCACFDAIVTKMKNLEYFAFFAKWFDILFGYGYLDKERPDLGKLLKLVVRNEDTMRPFNLEPYLQKLIAKFRFEYLDISEANISADTQEAIGTKLKNLKVLMMNGKIPHKIIMNKLSCGNNLEKFRLKYSSASGRIGLINFILRHPCIRFIDLSNAKDLDADLIHQIANVQKKRNHVLMIRVWESHLPPDMMEMYNGKNGTNLELTIFSEPLL